MASSTCIWIVPAVLIWSHTCLCAKSFSGNPRLFHGRRDSKSAEFGYQTHYYRQTLDHFSFGKSATTFLQRYMLNTQHWGGAETKAPIFVECGSEEALEEYLGSDFMWELGPTFKAMLVVIEHRYYGRSIVSKNQLHDTSALSYLTAEQALADFASLVLDLKANFSAEESPVVTFGGSYSGMLAAWMRLKYPHVTIGAFASSAPVLLFNHLVPSDEFFRVLSRTYMEASSSCFDTIKRSWSALYVEGGKSGGIDRLKRRLDLHCNITHDGELESIVGFLQSIFAGAAQYDFPFPNGEYPAYPVKEICNRIDAMPNGTDILTRVFAGASVVLDRLQQEMLNCSTSYGDEYASSRLWAWQECTEMVFAQASNPNNSMFPPAPFDLEQYMAGCKNLYGIYPKPNWITQEFGGHDIRTVLRHYASNIIFYNGLHDPWSSGGVLEDISESIVAIVAPEGAHCLDLFGSTRDDPEWLTNLRKEEIQHIQNWLLQYYADWNATHQSNQRDVYITPGKKDSR